MSALLENFHLLRPWALLALLPAAALWWAARQAADTARRWVRAIDPALLRRLVVGGEPGQRIGPHDLLLAGWVVTVLAVAGPTWRREPSPFADATPPVMIALKVAPSMTTTDLAPTRLDRARQKIADLLKAREGGAAGLIAYSGSAHLVLPPTSDREVVTSMAAALSPAIMPREGDRLGDAVALAAGVLRDGRQGGSILMVADVVAPGQAEALKASSGGWPLTFFVMLPEQAPLPAVDARIVRTTVDNDDVQAIARRLAGGGSVPAAPGETERWREAGYWLSLVVAALALGWFRRGWMIST